VDRKCLHTTPTRTPGKAIRVTGVGGGGAGSGDLGRPQLQQVQNRTQHSGSSAYQRLNAHSPVTGYRLSPSLCQVPGIALNVTAISLENSKPLSGRFQHTHLNPTGHSDRTYYYYYYYSLSLYRPVLESGGAGENCVPDFLPPKTVEGKLSELFLTGPNNCPTATWRNG